MLKPGTTLNEKYRLERPIGRGGMGTIWRAERLGWSSPVAVKLINLELLQQSRNREPQEPQPQWLLRFFSEARTAASIRSPHVVQILDHGVDPTLGLPFIVMELLDGETLEQRLERTPKLTPAATAHILSHVARALTRLHEAQMVHRDLKPSNIFLLNNDDEVLAKLLDFGITRMQPGALENAQLTATGEQLGTPYYMSPEQIRGLKTVDFRADLWALGVIAFECLTGRRPFDGDTLGALTLKICVEPLPRAAALAPVPAGFDEWFEKAVSRDRSLTFSSAREAAEALRALALLDVVGAPKSGSVRPGVSPYPTGSSRPESLDLNLGMAATTAATSSSMQTASNPPLKNQRAPIAALLAAATVLAAAAGIAFRSREGTGPAPSGSYAPDPLQRNTLTAGSNATPGSSTALPDPSTALPDPSAPPQAPAPTGSSGNPTTASLRVTPSTKKPAAKRTGSKAPAEESEPGTLPDGLINDRL